MFERLFDVDKKGRIMVKKIVSVVAALLIIYGFSLLHRETYGMERTGGILIGVGSLYFIVLLYLSSRKGEQKQSDEE